MLNSGQGRLDLVDPVGGQLTAVAAVLGDARGLALYRGYAFVGLSKARPSLVEVPIVVHREQLKCGLAIVDLRTGNQTAFLEFKTGVEEIFDVQVLPGLRFPFLSGPWAEQDTGKPMWTVPPTSERQWARPSAEKRDSPSHRGHREHRENRALQNRAKTDCVFNVD